MEKSFEIVCQLVSDFQANEKAFLSPSYQESQVRQDFIDKFYTALGWDVTHTLQKNPYEQEVKIENRVTTQGSQRRADYAFFNSPNYRDVKYFAEAKKPKLDLSNADFYHQTIRYGWNAKTPVAVLTDFEEFHILDCRYKPDIGAALNRKLKYYHYSEYADFEKFKEIFYLFGREAVANGSLDKYAANLPKSRGKGKPGVIGGYKAVDDAFLEQLDEYRSILAKAFKKENQELDGEELTEAVQRTIDRLVFIRFLEDKGIEEPVIAGLSDVPNAWKGFITLCKRLEPKYNGLIFKPHRILDGNTFHAPDDKAFAHICAELAGHDSPYDFDKIPISILGSIYERFLGKVVHATAKQVKVEEKPEVRKAGGVYYTPEYIVRYIVTETVGKLIEGKTPDEISTMAFADIACGSGSFLIEVYSQLLNYHERWYNEHPQMAEKEDTFERDGHIHLSLKKKKQILTNNVYGVDIDYQATEVTQLSLYLKLLENVTTSETHQLGLFKETILPNLNTNIVCGNSLIGTDINDGDLFGGKIAVDALKPMNFEDVFPKIMKRGGFEAVVGNPPYVRQELLTDLKSYLEKHYKVYQGAADLYTYFIERGISLLRTGGIFSYIVANKWMRANYGEPLRRWLADRCIKQLIDFGDLPVFQGISTYPCIVVAGKDKPNATLSVTIVKSLENLELSEYVGRNAFLVARPQLKPDGWTLSDQTSSMLLDKLKSVGVPLGKYVVGKIFRGVLTGLNEAFVIDDATKQWLIAEDPQCVHLIKPFLAGRDIKRYETPVAEKSLILIPSGWTRAKSGNAKDKWKWLIDTYPQIGNHLSQFREAASRRWDKGEYWWELRSCAYYGEFEKPKIIVPAIVKNGSYVFDIAGIYSNDKTCIISTDDKYLLGLLNSKVCDYVLHSIASTKQGGYFEYKPMYVEQLPIRTIDFSDPSDKARHDRMVKLVDQMLESKQKLAVAKNDAEVNRLELFCKSLDRQIDQAVYELYGLTNDEIKIVEGEV